MGERIMKTINEEAHAMSRALAKEKGIFPNWKLSIYAKKRVKMRNAALTTVAPTGSISMMFDCSSGIEPNFALSYIKQDKDGNQYHYFNKYFEEALKESGLSKAKRERIKQQVIEQGTAQHIKELPEELKRVFVVALDISAEDHIKMQAAFQRHVDNSISKTINFPNSATKEDVRRGFIAAWKLKCKSCTVYRDGSRVVQILNVGDGKNLVNPLELGNDAKKSNDTKKSEERQDTHLELPIDKNKLQPRKRPDVMDGKTYRVKTGYGNLYITINNDENGAPFEVFATIGKSGGFFQEQSEGICRMISLALRAGVKVEEVIDNLKGIRGPMPVMTQKGTILSLPDAIGRILEEHVLTTNGKSPTLPQGEELAPVTDAPEASPQNLQESLQKKKRAFADYGMMPGCPDCGAQLQISEGCISCRNCGFSRCT
ncbi:hypothetical protein D6779_06380 [Candidatus Parcubacteria bacterium]|nr:MAG: hypothetical protein D6779_06380 [Candidatus Parcubacteria bacterium]